MSRSSPLRIARRTAPQALAPQAAGLGYPRDGLHGRIVHAIGRRIVTGEIRPGEQLPTAAGVHASRGVVREAVKVLAAKGLVVSRPRTGTRVRPQEAWNLLDPDVLAWKQEGLLYRKLSAPAYFDGYVVVGDFEGYLHWLDPSTGAFVGRSRVGSDPIVRAPVAAEGLLYVMNTTGRVSAVTSGKKKPKD